MNFWTRQDKTRQNKIFVSQKYLNHLLDLFLGMFGQDKTRQDKTS